MKCAWINNHLVVETDGVTRPCCLETDKRAQISEISTGILKSFNHKRLLRLEQNLANGYSDKTDPYCRRCRFLSE